MSRSRITRTGVVSQSAVKSLNQIAPRPMTARQGIGIVIAGEIV